MVGLALIDNSLVANQDGASSNDVYEADVWSREFQMSEALPYVSAVLVALGVLNSGLVWRCFHGSSGVALLVELGALDDFSSPDSNFEPILGNRLGE